MKQLQQPIKPLNGYFVRKSEILKININMYKIVRGAFSRRTKNVDETVSIFDCNNLLCKEKK